MGHRNLLPCDPTLPQLPLLVAPRPGSVRRASGFVLVGKSDTCQSTSDVEKKALSQPFGLLRMALQPHTTGDIALCVPRQETWATGRLGNGDHDFAGNMAGLDMANSF